MSSTNQDALVQSIKALQKRNPDGLHVLAMVSGVPEKRINQIATGKGEPPSMAERLVLESMR